MAVVDRVEQAASVPPQNREAEEHVLGALMLLGNESPLFDAILETGVRADDFYFESHSRVFRAAYALHDRREPVDVITLTAELEARGELDGVGGRVRLHELAALVPATANATHYARIVAETSELRGIIHAGGELARIAFEPGDIDDVRERVAVLADRLLNRGGRASEPLDLETWQQFERSATETVPTLIDDLWPLGALGFIGAPPKKGKTWIALDLALSIAAGVPFLNQFPVTTPQPVILLALEGHRAALRGRIGALARGHGLDPDIGSHDLQNLHILYKPRGLNLSDHAWVRTIRDTAQRVGAQLLIVDVLRAAAVWKENSNDEFRDLVRSIDPIAATGCSIALIHHFGKLTELSKERSPGERMSGGGAMYGAFDVGVFITRSDDGARKLRVEIETRDGASPEPLGLHLTGEGTGKAGGFVYRDTATWQIEEAPDEADVKAPATEIAAYVREQGGDVERRYVEAYFSIGDKTLDRRRVKLEELGIDFVTGRGRGARSRLVARPDAPAEAQLFSSSSLSSDSELYDTPNKTPLNQADPGHSSESSSFPVTNNDEETKSAHMQEQFSSESSSSPTESDAPANAAPLTESAQPDTTDDWDTL